MNPKRILTVILSVINIMVSLFFVPIWLEYGEALFTGQTKRLQNNNILLDITIILITLAILAINAFNIIRYFRHKEIKLILPVICGAIYGLFFILQYTI